MSGLDKKPLEEMNDRELMEKLFGDVELLGGAINATAGLIDEFTKKLIGFSYRIGQLEAKVNAMEIHGGQKSIVMPGAGGKH